MRMGKNSLLEEITEGLCSKQPDWGEIFKEIGDDRGLSVDLSNLIGYVSEAHLRKSLEKMASGKDVDLDPISDQSTSDNFVFRKPHRHVLVSKKTENHQTYSEIDEIILADGLPVIFEVKITSYRSKGRGSPGKKGISYALSDGRVRYVTEPIREYFRCKSPGYVLVIPKNQIDPANPKQILFKERGGILVPFYAGCDRFKTEVETNARMASFRLNQ